MKRSFTKILICILCLTQIIAYFPINSFAEIIDNIDNYEKIYISSTEEFNDISKKCTSDIWSKNKKIILKNDLDFTSSELSPIPLFAGIFDGADHTIKGVNFQNDGSDIGFIRWILKDGIVKNLNICGNLSPSGTSENIGGIAGINEGSIENCTFNGSITAKNFTGGIAGTNKSSGVIIRCKAYGEINAFHKTGGLCGQNDGNIKECENLASVNRVYRTEVGGTIPSTSDEVLGITDIGGICGFNSGTIYKCVNSGKIGYPKTGYHVGGIAGSQSGKCSECTNNGFVLGRRDVGGIVGKLIPMAHWNRPEDRKSELSERIDKLEISIKSMIDNVKKAQVQTGTNLDEVIDSLTEAEKMLSNLSFETENWINGNIDTLNEILHRFDLFIRGLVPIGKSIKDFTNNLSSVFNHLKFASDYLKQSMSQSEPALDDLILVLDDVIKAMKETEIANDNIKTAFEHLDASFGDPKKVSAALTEVSKAFLDLSDAIQSISDRLSNINTPSPDESTGILQAIKALMDTLNELGKAMQDISADFSNASVALGQISKGLKILVEEYKPEELEKGLKYLRQSLEHITNLPPIIESASNHLKSAITHIKNAGPSFKNAFTEISSAFEYMSLASDSMGITVEKATKLMEILDAFPPSRFYPLGVGFISARTDLFKALENLQSTLKKFSANLTGLSIPDDLKNVTNELFLTIDSIENLLRNFDITKDIQTFIRDISPTVTDHTEFIHGSVDLCMNMGIIKGDTYVGGIVGTIENDKKITKDDIPNLSMVLQGTAEYTIYASIRRCVSYAPVTSEKNSAGGIAGYLEYGLIEDCISTGEIKTINSYVGGIAGNSLGYIRKCRSRTSLSGRSFTGGICGYGKYISECLALPYILSNGEYQGAVAGNASDIIVSNFYSGCNTGGVNGFSFSGQTEYASYDELLNMDIGSTIFETVTVSFILDDNSVVRKEIPYGTTVEVKPSVKTKDGFYWEWDELDSSVTHDTTLKGKYIRNKSSVSSNEDKPLFVIDGNFSKDSELKIENYSPEKLPENIAELENFASKKVFVTDCSSDLKIRFHTDKNGDLFITNQDGNLIKTDYERDGSYIVFNLENGSSFIYTEKEPDFVWLVILITSIITVFVICFVIIIICHKHKKNKVK